MSPRWPFWRGRSIRIGNTTNPLLLAGFAIVIATIAQTAQSPLTAGSSFRKLIFLDTGIGHRFCFSMK